MNLITRDVDYAIRALCCIAKKKEGLYSVAEIASCLKIPLPFLRKILQILNKENIVHSYKGKGGGFKLAIDPDKISLSDVITLFQGPISLNDHTFKRRKCPHIKECNLKKKLDRIEKIMVSELKAVTIRDIIRH
ncbi:MAG: Rrf2 family transcriptional regulator [Candidatus Omnitrophica bacterium]|nr:Rrf2 family transcriptional regulator [Candidatus Omnitrophota bacterium]